MESFFNNFYELRGKLEELMSIDNFLLEVKENQNSKTVFNDLYKESPVQLYRSYLSNFIQFETNLVEGFI